MLVAVRNNTGHDSKSAVESSFLVASAQPKMCIVILLIISVDYLLCTFRGPKHVMTALVMLVSSLLFYACSDILLHKVKQSESFLDFIQWQRELQYLMTPPWTSKS